MVDLGIEYTKIQMTWERNKVLLIRYTIGGGITRQVYNSRVLRTLEGWNSRSFPGFPGNFQQNSRLFLCDFMQQKRNSPSLVFEKDIHVSKI